MLELESAFFILLSRLHIFSSFFDQVVLHRTGVPFLLHLRRFRPDPAHIDGGALHAERNARDSSADNNFVVVLEAVQVTDEREEFAIGAAKRLTFNSLICKFA